MLRKFLYAALPLYAAVSLTSCENKDSFKKSPDGLEYKIVVDSAGKTLEEGGVAVINLSFKNDKDSLNTFKKGAPIKHLKEVLKTDFSCYLPEIAQCLG